MEKINTQLINEEEVRKLNMSSQAIQELVIKYQKCESSEKKHLRDKIILSCTKLVMFAVNNEIKKNQILSGSQDDLFQHGMIGVMTALDKYDIEKGYANFTTYAYKCIETEIRNGIQHQHLIYIPSETYYRHQQELIKNDFKPNSPILTSYQQATAQPLSLDQPVQNSEYPLMDSLASDCSVESNVDLLNMQEEVRQLLEEANLTDQEKLVLRHRYGLLNSKILAYREIGETIGKTRETIRLIDKKLLRKLAVKAKRKGLAIYI